MDYPGSLEYLFGLQRMGARMGTATVSSLLARIGDPQNSFPSVLVAGTNGKGSTCALLASILREAGLKVGLYTSPHLVRFEERIVVDGAEITPDEIARLASLVREQAEQMAARGGEKEQPSFFETATAIAFRYFQDRQVDLAVLEVGMGGRLDATSVVDAITSLFTPIGLDHQKHLGSTLEEIAAEKAGILKSGSRALTAPQPTEAMRVLQRCATIRGATLFEAEQMWRPLEGPGGTISLVSGMDPSKRIEGLTIALAGRHQWTNATLAVAAATRLPGFHERISEQAIRKGLAGARWPGRCEVVSGHPTLLLDGAHNPAAAQVLRSYLLENYTSKGRKVVMIFGAMQDKDLPGIMQPLFSCAARVIVTRAETPRAADPVILEGLARRYHASVLRAPSLSAALSAARQEAGEDGVICVTGSLYLVGDVKCLLEGQEPRFRQAL
jgi:dihydrofolate synthase / folylpolyglutamate synthase